MYGTAWKEATAHLVELPVAVGFRAIDTANQLIHYQEALVGEALQVLAKKGIDRGLLYFNQIYFGGWAKGPHPYDAAADLTTQVSQSFDSPLIHLGTDYLDSYVLDAPFQRRGLGAADWEVWAVMEELCRGGKTKMIGVSNITAAQLAQLCDQEV